VIGMMFADLALARRLESAFAWSGEECARVHARRHPGSGAASEPFAGGSAAFLGSGSPLSQAQGLGLDGPVAEAELDRMEAFFRDRGCAAQVEVSSLADPALLARLGRRGYRVSEQSHVLARPLRRGVSFDEVDSELWVHRIGPDEAGLWSETVMRCFHEGPDGPPAEMVEAGVMAVDFATAACWLARVGDDPAGGAALATHEGTAMLFGDGTLPAYRRRGVQGTLLRARLAHAASAGCELAVLCVQPGSTSQRNGERLGFRVAYARTMFVRD
jgi:hypothetical protein